MTWKSLEIGKIIRGANKNVLENDSAQDCKIQDRQLVGEIFQLLSTFTISVITLIVWTKMHERFFNLNLKNYLLCVMMMIWLVVLIVCL